MADYQEAQIGVPLEPVGKLLRQRTGARDEHEAGHPAIAPNSAQRRAQD